MNPTMQLPRDRVLALDPASVAAYLESHGWQADPRSSSGAVGVYRRADAPGAEILLPRDRSFADYALRLSEVLEALAATEHRKAWEVLDELFARRAGPPSPNGPVPGKRGASGSQKRKRRDGS
jgi:hypothetical protein